MLKGIITNVRQSTAKNGSSYCSVTIKDPSEHVINIWGSTSDKFPLFKLLTVTDPKSSDQGISATLASCKVLEPPQELLSLIPTPPTLSQWSSLICEIKDLLISYGCAQKQIDFFTHYAHKLYTPYSTMPAAKSNHHAFPGGLLAHTYQLLNIYKALFPALPYHTNPFIVSIACLFHDYLKLAEYDPKTYDYQPTLFLKGHVFGSAEVLGELMRQESFDPNLILHCQHAILAHHGKPEWGSLIPATPEAFTVHHCDMLSGHGVIYQDTPDNTKSFPLGTTIFHYD